MLLNDYIESLKKIISNLTTGGLNVTFRDYLFAAIGTFLLLCAIIALVVAVYFLILGPRKAYKKYMGILLDDYKELQLKIDEEENKRCKDRDEDKIKAFEKELTPLRKEVRKKRTIFFTALSLYYYSYYSCVSFRLLVWIGE